MFYLDYSGIMMRANTRVNGCTLRTEQEPACAAVFIKRPIQLDYSKVRQFNPLSLSTDKAH